MNFTVSRSRARLAALLGTASLGAMFASSAAFAQGAMMVAQDEIPETVLITGSLIAGTVPIGVPVTNLTPRDLAETGQLSLADILKSVPALDIDAQASPTYGGGTLSFEQNVQIHSLGTGSGVETLLMVNGLRFPPQNCNARHRQPEHHSADCRSSASTCSRQDHRPCTAPMRPPV
jgi:hypothetical protein